MHLLTAVALLIGMNVGFAVDPEFLDIDDSGFDLDLSDAQDPNIDSAAPEPTAGPVDWCFEFEEIEFSLLALQVEVSELIAKQEIYLESKALVREFYHYQVIIPHGQKNISTDLVRNIAIKTPVIPVMKEFIQETTRLIKNDIPGLMKLHEGRLSARLHPIYPRLVLLTEKRDFNVATSHILRVLAAVAQLVDFNKNEVKRVDDEINLLTQKVVSHKVEIRTCLIERMLNSQNFRNRTTNDLEQLSRLKDRILEARRLIETTLVGVSKLSDAGNFKTFLPIIRTSCWNGIATLVNRRDSNIVTSRNIDKIVKDIRKKLKVGKNLTGYIYYVCLEATDSIIKRSDALYASKAPRLERLVLMSDRWAQQAQQQLQRLDTLYCKL